MSINYRKSHSIRIAFLNISFSWDKIKLCYCKISLCPCFCVLLKRTEMKSWLLGYCKLMGQCRHMAGDCSHCWSTSQASALVIHFWLPPPPPHDPPLKCYPLNSFLSRESPSSPLFTPRVTPRWIKALFPIQSFPPISSSLWQRSSYLLSFPQRPFPSHHQGNNKSSSAFMPLWSPGVPPALSPLLCISAPRCGSPPTLHGRGSAVTSGSQPLLMPETDTQALNKEQAYSYPLTAPFSSHFMIFPPNSEDFAHQHTVTPSTFHSSVLNSAPAQLYSSDFYPTEYIKPCKLCQLLLLPLLLPWHASACSAQGGSPRVGHRAFWRATSLLDVPASPTAASNSHWRTLFFQMATLKSVLPVFAVHWHTESKPYQPSIWI